MKYEFLNNMSGAIVLLVVTLVFSMLFEPRFSLKRYLTSLIPFLIILFISNFYVIFKWGFSEYGKVTLLIATLPSLIYFFITSKNRDGRFLFTFCIVDTSAILLSLITGIIDYYAGAGGLLNFILRIIMVPFILLIVYKFVRKPYIELLHTVKKGWWLFTAITSLAYILLVTICSIPTSLRERPHDIPVAILIAVLLPLTYAIIFFVLQQQYKLTTMGTIEHAFTMQASMMKTRADEIRSAEEKVRIERHDLRHQFNVIEELTLNNKKDELLKFLGSVKKSLDEATVVHYCANPILDAILSHYFNIAKDNNIELETHINIPDEISVSPIEIATVFANTIENAIQANLELEEKDRKIVCTFLCYPTIMFEIKNPYKGKIYFDTDGLPIATKEGHGFGSKSIVAFCKKYNASYIYEAKDNYFKLVITL